MNQVIEPEHKHEVRADVEVRMNRKELNNKLVASVQVPANFERYPVHKIAANEQQGQKPEGPAVTPNENDQLINKGKAVYNKCLQILNKLQFPEEQGSQICQLLTESMLLTQQEEQEQQSNNSPGNPAGNATDTRPPPSGQIASNCARTAALDRELAIKREQVQQLNTEVAKERQAHLQRVARIASLENTLHKLKLDKYLSDYIVDEPVRDWQVRKMASKGMTVDDLREIYEGVPTRTRIRTASNNNDVQRPKSKVRLRTASTDESNSPDRQSHIQNTNERLANSYLGSSNLYDDYIG